MTMGVSTRFSWRTWPGGPGNASRGLLRTPDAQTTSRVAAKWQATGCPTAVGSRSGCRMVAPVLEQIAAEQERQAQDRQAERGREPAARREPRCPGHSDHDPVQGRRAGRAASWGSCPSRQLMKKLEPHLEAAAATRPPEDAGRESSTTGNPRADEAGCPFDMPERVGYSCRCRSGWPARADAEMF